MLHLVDRSLAEAASQTRFSITQSSSISPGDPPLAVQINTMNATVLDASREGLVGRVVPGGKQGFEGV